MGARERANNNLKKLKQKRNGFFSAAVNKRKPPPPPRRCYKNNPPREMPRQRSPSRVERCNNEKQTPTILGRMKAFLENKLANTGILDKLNLDVNAAISQNVQTPVQVAHAEKQFEQTYANNTQEGEKQFAQTYVTQEALTSMKNRETRAPIITQGQVVRGPYRIKIHDFDETITPESKAYNIHGEKRVMWVYNGEPDWPTYNATVQNNDSESVDVPFDVLFQNNQHPESYEALEFLYPKSRFKARDFKEIYGDVRMDIEVHPCVVFTEVRCHPLELVFDKESQSWTWMLTGPPKKFSLIVAFELESRRQGQIDERDEILEALNNEYEDKFGTKQGAPYTPAFHAGHNPQNGSWSDSERRRLTSKRLYERLQG